MKQVRSRWQSVEKVAEFAISGCEIEAVITDEHGYILASVVIAVVYDEEEREALYWALRKALEGAEPNEVIDDDQA